MKSNEAVLCDGIEFEYDGAPDARKACPLCGDTMDWQFTQSRFLACECGVLVDVETERVYAAPHDSQCPCDECTSGDFDPARETYPSRA